MENTEQQRPRRGRPPGFKPQSHKRITHRVGEWSWNSDNLHTKLAKTTPEACWAWLGSKNPYANIFGAYKNDKPQMTQANRLLAMEQEQRDITGLAVFMRCGNTMCCNPNHFNLLPMKGTKRITVDAKNFNK